MSNKSESIKELAAALAAAQAEMPAAPMDGFNPFLKNKFASLGSVIQTAQPVLSKHGLAVSQLAVSMGPDAVGITTILMHNSGEWLESTVALPLGQEKGKSQAQLAGSIITYLRRYSLSALLGIYSDEDSDGEPKKKAPAPKAEQATPSRHQAEAERKAKAAAKWNTALVTMGITDEKALKCLGTASVNEWIKGAAHRTLDSAIEEINSML